MGAQGNCQDPLACNCYDAVTAQFVDAGVTFVRDDGCSHWYVSYFQTVQMCCKVLCKWI